MAQATPPTVTLPRIKVVICFFTIYHFPIFFYIYRFQALTTGGIPGFVDVVMNFGSAELKDDSLIEQWSRAGR